MPISGRSDGRPLTTFLNSSLSFSFTHIFPVSWYTTASISAIQLVRRIRGWGMFFNTSSVIFLSLLPHLRFTLISRSGLSMPPLASFTSDTFVWRNYCSFICDFITALIVASVSTIALTLPPSSSVNMSTSGDLRRDRGSAQKEIIARSATSTDQSVSRIWFFSIVFL